MYICVWSFWARNNQNREASRFHIHSFVGSFVLAYRGRRCGRVRPFRHPASSSEATGLGGRFVILDLLTLYLQVATMSVRQ